MFIFLQTKSNHFAFPFGFARIRDCRKLRKFLTQIFSFNVEPPTRKILQGIFGTFWAWESKVLSQFSLENAISSSTLSLSRLYERFPREFLGNIGDYRQGPLPGVRGHVGLYVDHKARRVQRTVHRTRDVTYVTSGQHFTRFEDQIAPILVNGESFVTRAPIGRQLNVAADAAAAPSVG